MRKILAFALMIFSSLAAFAAIDIKEKTRTNAGLFQLVTDNTSGWAKNATMELRDGVTGTVLKNYEVFTIPNGVQQVGGYFSVPAGIVEGHEYRLYVTLEGMTSPYEYLKFYGSEPSTDVHSVTNDPGPVDPGPTDPPPTGIVDWRTLTTQTANGLTGTITSSWPLLLGFIVLLLSIPLSRRLMIKVTR